MNIAVTGIGIVSSPGIGCKANLQALLNEQTGIQQPCILNTIHREYPVGEVKATNDNLKKLLNINPAQLLSRTALLAITALRETLTNARIPQSGKEFQTRQMAFINGTTVGGMDITEQIWREKEQYADLIAEHHSVGATTKHIMAHVGTFAYHTSLSTACSSSLNAIIYACNLIRTHRYEQVVAGGAEALSLFHFNGFRALQILSQKPCRPFAQDRDGINLGEGAAYLLLESETSAKKRNVPILCYIGGYANACDAFHQTATSEQGNGPALSMLHTLQMAQVESRQIDYINTHGTATPNNDQTEINAMTRIFGQDLNHTPFSSTKPFTGHTTSAAGSIETVLSILALQNNFIPPNLGNNTSFIHNLQPPQHLIHKKLNFILCNAFGFGGNDSSILLSANPINLPDIILNTKSETTGELCVNETYDYKKHLTPPEARRLTPAMRILVSATRQVLQQSDIRQPDAIIAGTDLGCIANTVQLLDKLVQEGENGISPTLFMQSTHNTPATLLAILLQCHEYNNTFSNNDQSYDDALLDAEIQMQNSNTRTCLVIDFNEWDKTWLNLMNNKQTTQHTIKVTLLKK